MIEDIKFKSYCWSLGTTSFRVKDLNFKIEKQLQMLNELWSGNDKEEWSGNEELQTKYYNIMKNNGFVTGTGNNKSKDARQKTSGLVELGVIDENRNITEIGQSIIQIVEQNDFEPNNIFNINKDSYVYLKQLLKLEKNNNDEFRVKPFILLLYILSQVKYITKEEFSYIVPLCTKNEAAKELVNNIIKLRRNEISVEDIIIKKMYSMTNYCAAIEYINTNEIDTIEKFAIIDMGRKGTKYIEGMYKFYNELYEMNCNGISEKFIDSLIDFMRNETSKNSKVAKFWKQYFDFNTREVFTTEYAEKLKKLQISNIMDKKEYTKLFFEIMHIAKIKATLEDYADLNKRYLSLTDILIFKDEKIELDLFPKYFFEGIAEELLATEFNSSYVDFINKDIAFEDVYGGLKVDVQQVIQKIKSDYPDYNITQENISSFISDQRLIRFNNLIDEKFDNKNLIKLYNHIKKNERKDVIEYTDWESDLPTIFEYLLAITWYKLSNREGNVLEFMKLSLDANLYPKTHAGGGTADIVFEHNKTNYYEHHKVLLEATLTESTNQRRAEMEPVSRHLMREHQLNNNKNTYVVFVTGMLHEEVVSDFRARKSYTFRLNDGNVQVGMKIICLEIEDIIEIINKSMNYIKLYRLFDEAFKDTNTNDLDWYPQLIKSKLQEI